MKRYDGKRALIIGGTSGIGLATARLLVDEGVHVLATGRDAAAVDATQDQLGGDATVVSSDLTSADDLEQLVARVGDEVGQLDLLFVNAGITRNAPLDRVDEAMYDEVFAINTKGPYFAVQRFASLMAQGSAVVITTSISDVLGQPAASVYAASKAAVRSMVRTLARELQARGIRVNAVSPGPTDTGILDRSMGADDAQRLKQQMAEHNPMKRFGRPDEVARAVVFLAFEATFTTGAELPIDGGASQL